MAPVKKFAITMTSLTALALVMSACAGNLEAKKLGTRTGVQKLNAQAQPAVASEDGASSFNEKCEPSSELQGPASNETEISAAELIDGKSNKYILLRNEVFSVEETKTQALVISAKGEGENAAVVCHNNKEGSAEIRISKSNPNEIDSNDGLAAQDRVTDFVAQNGKVGAKTSLIDSGRKESPLLKLDEMKKNGGALLVTKDDAGLIRIRYSDKTETKEKAVLQVQLTVYKAIAASDADAAKSQGQAQAEEEAKQKEEQADSQPKSAQEAADAVAREAGIPAHDQGTTTTTSTTQAEPDKSAENDEEMTEEEQQAMQEQVAQRAAEISAEIARKLAEKQAAEQEAKARAAIAKVEAAQQASSTTTTSTTQPTRTSRPADAIDYTTPGSYPRH